MKIRDSWLKEDEGIVEIASDSLDIIADDGRPLFSINLKDNVLSISSGMVCKHDGIMLDDRYVISPVASNLVRLTKLEYNR